MRPHFAGLSGRLSQYRPFGSTLCEIDLQLIHHISLAYRRRPELNDYQQCSKASTTWRRPRGEVQSTVALRRQLQGGRARQTDRRATRVETGDSQVPEHMPLMMAWLKSTSRSCMLPHWACHVGVKKSFFGLSTMLPSDPSVLLFYEWVVTPIFGRVFRNFWHSGWMNG